MKKVISSMIYSITRVLSIHLELIKEFFSTDMDVMSNEGKEIMSNPKDRKAYLDAIRELRDNDDIDEVDVKLESGKSITLIK